MSDGTEGRAALILISQILRIIDDQAREAGGTGVLELMEAGLVPAGPDPAEMVGARQLAVTVIQALRQARVLADAAVDRPPN